MSKNWELIGRDVLVTERTTYENRPHKKIALRLPSVVRWEPANSTATSSKTMTNVWLNDGREMLEIVIPFEEFTRIIAMPLVASLDD